MADTARADVGRRDRMVCLVHSVGFGMLHVGLLPGLTKPLEQAYFLTHGQMGTLLAMGAGLSCAAAIVLGAVADRRGASPILSMSMVVIAASAFAIWQAKSTVGGIAALLIFHFAAGSYFVANGLVFALYGAGHAGGLNLFHGLQGIGRLLAPLVIVAATLVTGTWRTVFLMSFLVHLGLAFLYLNVHEPPHPEGQKPIAFSGILEALLNRRYIACLAVFVFVSGCEISMITWVANYLEREAGFVQAQALLGLTIMMSGYTGIRLVLGFTRIEVGIRFMAAALALNIASYVLLMFVVRHVLTAYAVCFLLGASFGPFWPCAASLLLRRLRGGRGLLSGVFGVGSALGAIISLSVVGWLGDCFSLRAALVVTPVSAAIFVAIYRALFLGTPGDVESDGLSGEARRTSLDTGRADAVRREIF